MISVSLSYLTLVLWPKIFWRMSYVPMRRMNVYFKSLVKIFCKCPLGQFSLILINSDISLLTFWSGYLIFLCWKWNVEVLNYYYWSPFPLLYPIMFVLYNLVASALCAYTLIIVIFSYFIDAFIIIQWLSCLHLQIFI
jgi:hypothetical protein